jgi:hypothetical protein
MSAATCGISAKQDPDVALLIRATAVSFVIARSVSDEAIHPSASGAMDCFASLAMTKWREWARQIDPTGKSLLIFRNRVKPKN